MNKKQEKLAWKVDKKQEKLAWKVVKGASLSFIIGFLANLITLNGPNLHNVLVGTIIGTVVYLLFHMDS